MHFIFLKDEQRRQAIMEWHGELHNENHRGNRARLRRCDKYDSVMLEPAYFKLCRMMPKINAEALALVAGLLAWAEHPCTPSKPTAVLLGKTKPDSDTPLFSELRFQRLLASNTADDFYQNMRRAIIQLEKTADPMHLADEILHWHAQHKQPDSYQGTRQWSYRMARAYYEPQSLASDEPE